MKPGGTFESHYDPAAINGLQDFWVTILGMHPCGRVILRAVLARPSGAQTPTTQNLASILGFENFSELLFYLERGAGSLPLPSQ